MRLAVFADLNANLVDGSTIWLKNVCTLLSNAFAHDDRICVFLRDPISDPVVTAALDGLNNVQLIEPSAVVALDSIQYEKLPTNRLSHIVATWEAHHGAFDYVFSRGYDYGLQFGANTQVRRKLVVYWAYPPLLTNPAKDKLLQMVSQHNIKVVAQTRSVRHYLEVFGNVLSGSIYELPPIVDPSFFAHQQSQRSNIESPIGGSS